MAGYEFEPVIVKVNKEGKIELTEEELEKILKKAFADGYVVGQLSIAKEPPLPTIEYPKTTPINPYIPNNGEPIIWGKGGEALLGNNNIYVKIADKEDGE